MIDYIGKDYIPIGDIIAGDVICQFGAILVECMVHDDEFPVFGVNNKFYMNAESQIFGFDNIQAKFVVPKFMKADLVQMLGPKNNDGTRLDGLRYHEVDNQTKELYVNILSPSFIHTGEYISIKAIAHPINALISIDYDKSFKVLNDSELELLNEFVDQINMPAINYLSSDYSESDRKTLESIVNRDPNNPYKAFFKFRKAEIDLGKQNIRILENIKKKPISKGLFAGKIVSYIKETDMVRCSLDLTGEEIFLKTSYILLKD